MELASDEVPESFNEGAPEIARCEIQVRAATNSWDWEALPPRGWLAGLAL